MPGVPQLSMAWKGKGGFTHFPFPLGIKIFKNKNKNKNKIMIAFCTEAAKQIQKWITSFRWVPWGHWPQHPYPHLIQINTSTLFNNQRLQAWVSMASWANLSWSSLVSIWLGIWRSGSRIKLLNKQKRERQTDRKGQPYFLRRSSWNFDPAGCIFH